MTNIIIRHIVLEITSEAVKLFSGDLIDPSVWDQPLNCLITSYKLRAYLCEFLDLQQEHIYLTHHNVSPPYLYKNSIHLSNVGDELSHMLREYGIVMLILGILAFRDSIISLAPRTS